MSKTLSVIFDGEVFRPETPTDLVPNTRYEITLQPSQTEQPLDQLFTFTDPVETKEFLVEKPDLVQILREAYPVLRTYFPSATFLVRLAFKPIKPAENQLVLAISTDDNRAEVLSKFNALKLDWWQATRKKAGDALALVLETPHESRSLFDSLQEIAGIYDGPQDWSAESAHYLHGTPKIHNTTTDE